MTDRLLEREPDSDSFDAEAIRRAIRAYVEPECSWAGPSGTVTAPLTSRIDELLSLPGAGRRYLLLAEAGMGKTAFLFHYFERNRKRRGSKRVPMVMVSLHGLDALNQLEQVQAKGETVAFLDAFDEDTRALENRERRLQEIVAACSGFKCVLMACTPQFVAGDEAIFAKHAFETIHLAPFAERQIDEYLRRSIPWHQRKQRREANALVASMGEFATRPSLIALVPELVSAGRQITELFELYEFMVETWLERERDSIPPDTLRAIAEKLAVAIHAGSAAGGTDRLAAVQIADGDTLTLEQWQPAAGSILKRDALGRFAITQPPLLEFLFVSALLHGETQALSVRWTGFMRRLFVSATNVLRDRRGAETLRPVLMQNFAATGLFPLSEPHAAPKRLDTSGILNSAIAPTATALDEGPLWDPTLFVLEHHVDDSLYLCDRSSDTIFFVPTDWRRVESGAVDPESARLFLVARGEADGQLMKVNELQRDDRANWRLPTLEELDLVFLLNQQLAFLPPEQYVWSGDQTMEGERLVARMHHSVKDLDARLNPIGVRKVLGADRVTARYFVSSMPPLGVRDRRGNFDASFPALLIRVSQGAAEAFSVAVDRHPTSDSRHRAH